MKLSEFIKSKLEEKKETDPSLKPPKLFWKKCIAGVSKNKDVTDPSAVCGSAWYKKMSKTQRKEAREKEGKTYGQAPENK